MSENQRGLRNDPMIANQTTSPNPLTPEPRMHAPENERRQQPLFKPVNFLDLLAFLVLLLFIGMATLAAAVIALQGLWNLAREIWPRPETPWLLGGVLAALARIVFR